MAASTSDLEKQWRTHVIAGNHAFGARDNAEATIQYQAAEKVANDLYAVATTCDRACVLAPALGAIACHNLATLEQKAGRPEQALACLATLIQQLTGKVLDPDLPQALRHACLRNLVRSYALAHEVGGPEGARCRSVLVQITDDLRHVGLLRHHVLEEAVTIH